MMAATASVAQAPPPVTLPQIVPKQFEVPVAPKAKPPLPVPRAPRLAPPSGAERIRFVLNAVVPTGNTVISTDRLRPQWQEFLAKEISLLDVYEIAAGITTTYRNEGYILSRAIVPPQDISRGSVRITVVEGYIDDVKIQGRTTGPAFQIRNKIAGIKKSRPLRAQVLERYMLLLNDLPGLSAQSILRPSQTVPGASDLIIVVKETHLSGALSVDNRGTRFMGPHQGIATFNFSNIMRVYDQTQIRLIMSGDFGDPGRHNRLRYGSFTHTQQLTSEGTSLTISASRTLTKPRSVLTSSDISGRATKYSASLKQPIIRTRSDNLTAEIAFDYLNAENTILDALDTDDAIRTARIGATFDFVDRWRGINLIGLSVTQGLDIMGSRKSGSTFLTRENGHSDFSKVNINLAREQDLGTGFSVLGAASGQYAFSQLLASQEIGIGGTDFGRGYDLFEISGDHGYAAKLEFRFGRESGFRFIDTFQVYGFYDVGTVWRRDKTRLASGVRDSAASAGAGVRLNFTPNLFGFFEVTRPLTRIPTTDRDDNVKSNRFFMRLTTRF